MTVTVLWGKKYCRYTLRSVCPPVCPTDSSSNFCPKNSVCHPQKKLTHQVFVMIINHHSSQPSRLKRQWTFPQKTASIPTRLTGDTLGKHTDVITVTSPSRLFRSHSASFLCELHSGSSLRRSCFSLCESPLVENWRTAAAAFTRLLLFEWVYATVSFFYRIDDKINSF